MEESRAKEIMGTLSMSQVNYEAHPTSELPVMSTIFPIVEAKKK